MSGGRLINSIFTDGTCGISGVDFDRGWLFPISAPAEIHKERQLAFIGDRFTINGDPVAGLDALDDRMVFGVPANVAFGGAVTRCP